jgi:alkyl hydroperoxide reductase subunit AhpC
MTADGNVYSSPTFQFRTGTLDQTGNSMASRVGAPAPDLNATTLDGQQITLSDLQGNHTVIMTGSVTSPMCCFEIPNLNKIQDEFGPKGIRFYLLYSRESHAGDNYPSHESFEQKMANARDLQRLENVQFPIIVDGLDGATHLAYGPWPSSLFVISKDGLLVYRTNMSNSQELEQVLEDLLKADELKAAGAMLHNQYSERIIPHLADKAAHRRVIERSDPNAIEHMWQQRPELRNVWP